MTQKTLIRLAVVAVALFILAYALSPLVAARGLVQAAKTGDVAGLERHVDFPAFRNSLKSELSHRLMGELSRSQSDRGLAALGMVFGSAIVEGAVDSLVTPQTIADMVQDGKAPTARAMVDRPSDKPSSRVRQSWSYRNLDTFAVSLTRDDKPDERVALLMTRRNLFFWKLSGVDLSRPE